MNENVVRKFVPVWRIIAFGAVLTATGCGMKTSSEYRTYAELEKKEQQHSLSVEAQAGKPTSTGEVKVMDSPQRGISPAGDASTVRLSAASAAKMENSSTAAANSIENKTSTTAAGRENSNGQRVAFTAASDGEKLANQKAGSVEAKAPVRDSIAVVGDSASQNADVIVQQRRSNPVTAVGALGRLPVVAARPGQNRSGTSTAAVARKVQLLVPTKEFKTEGPDGAIRVSYNDIDLLKVLNMEPVTPDAPKLMPSWLKGLDGKRIRIRGFMYPTFQETGLRGFVLARDNQICCFGRNPKIYDIFSVALRPGVTTDYIQNRPFDVVGVFHIHPEELDGELLNLYEMDDAHVIDK